MTQKYLYSLLSFGFLILLSACTEDIPSHSVTLKVTDSVGVPVSANSPIANIEVSAYAQTSDKQPDDIVTEASTGDDGVVTLKLGEFTQYVDMFPADYMGANVYFKVGASDVDFSEYPIVLPERYNHCSNVLGISGTGEGWLRVYKTTAAFDSDDTLVIEPVGHANTVNAGADIAEAPVTAAADVISNIDHIDIYLGTTPSSDTLGHKSTSIVYESGGTSDLKYDVTLNNVTIRVQASNCGHAYSMVYF